MAANIAQQAMPFAPADSGDYRPNDRDKAVSAARESSPDEPVDLGVATPTETADTETPAEGAEAEQP